MTTKSTPIFVSRKMDKPRSKIALLALLSAVASALLLAGCATPMPRPDATNARRIGPLVEWQETTSGASLFALRPWQTL